mgnify:CR=1
MNNKKAGERIMAFWWFLVFALIGTFIIVGVIIFYSETIDMRGIEAGILNGRIADCVIKNGNIDEFVNEKNFDFYSKCLISDKEQDFYGKVSVYEFDSCKKNNELECTKLLFEKGFGQDFSGYCELQKVKGNQRKLPQCAEKDILANINTGKVVLRIVTASNQKSGEIWKS